MEFFILTQGLQGSSQRFAEFDLYWVELFILTQGLRCSAQRFAGLELYWVEFFFYAGFAVFFPAFRRV